VTLRNAIMTGNNPKASFEEVSEGMVAECLLAAFFRVGAGDLERNESQANELCRRAYLRGFEYEQVEDDVDEYKGKAVLWYRCASSGGHSHAMWALACCLERESEGSPSALTWLSRAAEAGCPQAQTSLGVHFVKEGDYPRAVEWYTLAAAGGDKNAGHNLGLLYATGQGVTEEIDKARKIWMNGVEGGNGRCALRLAELCMKLGESAESAAAEAEASNVLLQESTASDGVNVPGAADFKEGVQWFRKAAEMGEAEGYYYLFVAHRTGKGAEQSDERALEALHAAAEKGLNQNFCREEGEDGDPGAAVRVRSAYVLGSVYENGELGQPVDHEKALDWWTIAAENNHPCSMVRIGVLLRNKGEKAQAEKWFRLAARLGHTIPGEGETHSH